MGKTSQPLKIGCFDDWLLHPEMVALRAMGHEVRNLDSINQFDVDLILHPSAHYWCEELFSKPSYLEAALKRARAKKRASK